jgi:tetratricopeptide (TPR) repeat protein
MLLNGLRERARKGALELDELDDLPAAEEKLRADLSAYWAQVPEPPAYRRKDEPLRARAEALLEEAVPLLTRGVQLEDSAALQPYLAAFDAHLQMLSLLAQGQVEAADEHWRRALRLEREAARAHRLWTSSEEGAGVVFDRATGASRYDPQPEETYAVRLLCANCRAPGDYRFSPRHASHRFACHSCQAPFSAYVAELRSQEVTKHKHGHRYVFRVEELSGVQTRIEFDDGGQTELGVARRDLIAFLYNRDRELKGVLNLTSSRVLWTSPPGGCFLATAVYGPEARELDDFRAFRDQVLLPRGLGRVFVTGYYAVGPSLARAVQRSPLAVRATRGALEQLRGRLGARP